MFQLSAAQLSEALLVLALREAERVKEANRRRNNTHLLGRIVDWWCRWCRSSSAGLCLPNHPFTIPVAHGSHCSADGHGPNEAWSHDARQRDAYFGRLLRSHKSRFFWLLLLNRPGLGASQRSLIRRRRLHKELGRSSHETQDACGAEYTGASARWRHVQSSSSR